MILFIFFSKYPIQRVFIVIHRTHSQTLIATEFLILVGSAVFVEVFLPGYTCRTIIIFGTLKNSGLKVDIVLAVNNFSFRNFFF